MIERYTRMEMGEHWTQDARFECLKDVELAVAKAQADLGIIPKEASDAIQKKAAFNIPRILEIEKDTKHYIIVFVTCMAEAVGL